MRKIFALGATLLALTGCVAPSTSRGWKPKDKYEMEMLIGETTMKALSQFFMQAHKNHQQPRNDNPVNPLTDERL